VEKGRESRPEGKGKEKGRGKGEVAEREGESPGEGGGGRGAALPVHSRVSALPVVTQGLPPLAASLPQNLGQGQAGISG